MKINVELDCTPDEARKFLGLPDVSKANEVYVEAVAKAMHGIGDLEKLQEMARQMAPMGQMGMQFVQQLVEGLNTSKKA